MYLAEERQALTSSMRTVPGTVAKPPSEQTDRDARSGPRRACPLDHEPADSGGSGFTPEITRTVTDGEEENNEVGSVARGGNAVDGAGARISSERRRAAGTGSRLIVFSHNTVHPRAARDHSAPIAGRYHRGRAV